MKARAWVFVAPWAAGLAVFTLFPFVSSLYYSFTDYSVLRPPTPAGLANYGELAADPIFRRALGNTFLYAAMALVPGILMALGLAKLLNARVRGTSFYRAAIYIPHLVPTVASAILWMWMLNADSGLINSILRPLLETVGWKPPTFLGDERLAGLDFGRREVIFGALPSLALMSLWGCGQMAIIYLAKFQEVPQELYEAAELDGAGPLSVFLHVELPQISPVILFNVVMGIIGTFQIFAEPFILTNGDGGPNYATYLVPMFIYQNAFEYQRMGYACAAAWLLFGLIALLTLAAFRIGQKRVYYAGE
ncbi:MAG: sugar ABC transporter permease [Planctomycetota bacterium]|nr:sugar ABC transporter permease [Planctomycetota bacterium]